MIVGIIPARGGSKGIPRKNLREIAGKPLIVWSIEAAKDSKLLDAFFVSTEDEEIAKVAKKYGAKVIDRPEELATDDAKMMDVLKHALETTKADAIVLLQPTSPVREKGLVDKCIKIFKEKNADSLATGFICKYYEYGSEYTTRQKLPGFFYDDGNVYIFDENVIRSGKRMGKKSERVIISKEQNFEIDEEFDFWLVEQILLKRNKSLND